MKQVLALIFIFVGLTAAAQATPEELAANPNKCGGVYFAYPVTESHNTPAPKGYTPFYISHYGRHGSRYQQSDGDYTGIASELIRAQEAGALTPFGEDVLERMKLVLDDIEGRAGELTPLGYRQHAGIARRMYEAYPQVFDDNAEITAVSTKVMRCAHSMFAFVQALKELNPSLVIPVESSKRNMYYLDNNGPAQHKFIENNGRLRWREEFERFSNSNVSSERIIEAIFSDPEYVKRNVSNGVVWPLYWFAVSLQSLDTPVSLFDIFTEDELWRMWQVTNLNFYMFYSCYPRAEGAHLENAKNLLRNILETADTYVDEGRHGATLRFGHDGNIVPLLALMRVEGCYGYETDPARVHEVWNTFRVTPMAANLQLVFFKNKRGDVIVKVMHNEREVHLPIDTDMFPFYRWSDVREYMQQTLDTPAAEFMPEEFKNLKY